MLMVYNNVRNPQITRWHQRRIDSNLSDGGHLGDDRQVVDDERNRLLLVLGQILSVAEDAEPRSVTARFPLLSSDTATYRQGYGCVLEPFES